jgi:hypothetical protein
MIKKFEDDLKVFNAELKKRDFYFFKTGVSEAFKKLNMIQDEIKVFDERIEDLGYNATKFGSPDLIQNSMR